MTSLFISLLTLLAGIDNPSESHTWIAGPIVGSVAGLALILGGLFYFWLRQRKAKGMGIEPDGPDPTFGKPQLHSDCISKPETKTHAELHPECIHEIHGSPCLHQAEKPANEVPAQELPG